MRFAGVPSITQNPQSRTVPTGGSATFTVAATGAQPLSYQWQRDTVNIPGATATSYTINNAQPQDNGATFRCRVSNTLGLVTSAAATLTVSDNRAPTAFINSPPNGSDYNAGDTIFVSGSATDPEEGTLPGAAFSWTVVFHHDSHTHPFRGPITGVTDAFEIPTSGETAVNVFYRIHLTVTDSSGAQGSTYIDIFPNTVVLTLLTDPPGLDLTLDGQPVSTPFSFESVVGMLRTLGAPPQRINRSNYSFSGWSDGGAQTHEISTPEVDSDYLATYRRKGGRK